VLKKDIGLLILIIVVGAVVAIINPRFLSTINIANTANLVGLVGIFAIGQGFVIITGGIELSVGSIIALLGVIFIDLIANQGVPWPVAALVVVALGFAMGLVHGLLVTRMKLQPFVVTLCGLLIYRGIARFYTHDATAGFPFGVNFPTLEWLTTGRTDLLSIATGGALHSMLIPHSFVFMVILAVVMWFVLHRSVFGRYLFAVGKNEEAARFSGIRTTKVIVAAYVICAMLTAVAAIFFAMYTRSILPSGHGSFYELYAIAAAVLGGFSLRGGEGSIIGVVLGVILLQVLQNLVNLLGIPTSLNFAVMGSVILIGVLADSQFTKYRERRRQLDQAPMNRGAAVAPVTGVSGLGDKKAENRA
jgi:ribose transport system permease protein